MSPRLKKWGYTSPVSPTKLRPRPALPIHTHTLWAEECLPCFQRVVNVIISKYNCKGTYAYLDDITVCGRTCVEHDENLKSFQNAAKKCKITFNEKQCTYATDSIKLLGYSISNGMLQLDPDRVKPLLELPVPNTGKELQRLVGIFAYYAQWFPCFSEKIKPLIATKVSLA